jgi:hypothetical protein
MKDFLPASFARSLLSLVALTVFSGCCLGQQGGNLVLPAATLGSGSTLYQAPNSIMNGAGFVVQAAASVTFTAGNYIRLEPGFHAIAGSAAIAFHAIINPNVQSAPITISAQPPPASKPSKEYIYLGGRVIAIENPH